MTSRSTTSSTSLSTCSSPRDAAAGWPALQVVIVGGIIYTRENMGNLRAPDVPFMANNVPYKRGYYLSDRIYPQWAVLIKSIKNSGTNDHKRILYKTKHEAARKDAERAFGVLKKKWKLIKYPARGMSRRRLSNVMYTCIILHNMIIHDNGEAICPDFFPEVQHRDDDPVRTHVESMQVTQEIINRTTHLSLKADLVEHIWNNAN
ncbi:ALP1-like protein [Tanacetum coccineum]